MSGVYSLSTTVEINCILPKLSLKIDKEAIHRSFFLKHLRTATSPIKLFKLHILLYVKNWATFHHFFPLQFSKVLYDRPYDTGGAEEATAPSPLFRQAIFFAQNTQRREIKKVPNLYACQAKHMFLRRHTRVPPLILHIYCKICHGLLNTRSNMSHKRPISERPIEKTRISAHTRKWI